MQLSDILAPWEFDAKAPPEVVSHLRADGCLIALIAEEGRSRYVVFRLDGDDGSWAVGGDWSLETPYFLPAYHGAMYEPSHRFLRQGVQAGRGKERICRVMFAHEGETSWRFCVAPSGAGTCQILQGSGEFAPYTPFFLGRETRDWSSSQTREYLAGEGHATASPLSFAQRFHLTSNAKKLCQLFGFNTEEEFARAQGELNALARFVLQREASLWLRYESLLWSLQTRLGNSLQTKANPYSYEAPPSYLHRWADALLHFGPLQPQADNLTLEHFEGISPPLFRVSVDAPTAHEQIEAHLALREWASGHLPPDVRAELEEFGF